MSDLPGKPGRKKIDINIEEVEFLASQGLSNIQICDALGISSVTFYRRKSELGKFETAIKRGKAKGIAKVVNALFDNAMQGNVSAQIFFLKNRAGWADRVENEIEIVDFTKTRKKDIEAMFERVDELEESNQTELTKIH